MSFLRAHKIEILIFIIALVARIVFLGVSLHAHGGDLVTTIQGADGYFTVSQNIINGHGFSDSAGPPYLPYSFRPPLYHYFIAWSYWLLGGYWGVIALQILIASLLPVLAMYITRYMFSRSIALWTGGILALEPVSILFSTVFYSETFFMLLFFLSLLYLFNYFKNRKVLHLVFSASFLGFATLTRPTSEYLSILIVSILLVMAYKAADRILVGHALVYAVVFVVILSPWLYRNYSLFGTAALSPQIGVNLYANVVPSMLAIEHGTSYQKEFAALMSSGVSGPNGTNVGGDKGYTQTAVRILLAHPKATATLMLNTELAFFTHDGMFDVLRHVDASPDALLGKPAVFLLFSDPKAFFGFVWYYLTKPAALILVMRIVWYALTVLCIVGACRYVRRVGITPPLSVAVSTIAYFALTVLLLGLTINARYRLPVEFLIIPLALYGLVYLKTLWRPSR